MKRGGGVQEFKTVATVRYNDSNYSPPSEDSPMSKDSYVSKIPLEEFSFLIDDSSSYIRSYKITLIVFDQVNKTYNYTQKTITK